MNFSTAKLIGARLEELYERRKGTEEYIRTAERDLAVSQNTLEEINNEIKELLTSLNTPLTS